MSEGPHDRVMGPVVELAAKVKAALEREKLDVETEYGIFYVGEVTLKYYGMGSTEVVGVLTPDEAEGSTFDFYVPKV